MYQKSIIKSIIKYKSSEGISSISDKSKIIFTNKTLLSIYDILKQITSTNQEAPDIKFLNQYFKIVKDSKLKDTYKEIVEDDSIDTVKNIKGIVELQLQYQVRNKALEVIREAEADIKISSISNFKDKSSELIDNLSMLNKALDSSNETEGIIYHDPDTQKTNDIKDKILKEYDLRKSGRKGYYKFNTGISQIDQVIGGIHSVDFIGLLGYVKNGKSYLARQIAYNVLSQGMNVLFISIEMSYESVLHSFLSLHANNTKIWGYDSPKIKTNDIRLGTLDSKSEKFFKDKVIDDFTTNPNFGTLYLKQPEGGAYTPSKLMSDIRIIKNSVMDIDLIVIDYITLLKPDNGRSDRENINNMFREIRHFSLVNHIPVISPIQMNRSGWINACKDKDNLISTDAIGEFSSIEKECTNIFSILTTDEMKESGVSQIQHILSRESSLFPPFKINSDFETGVLSAINTVIDKEDAMQIMEEINI